MRPREILVAFDQFLAGRGLRFEAVVIGGTALNLLGIISRETRDCDVLYPRSLPPEIASAANEFAAEQRAHGTILRDDWLNDGPAQVGDVLPTEWRERAEPLFTGTAVVLLTLGRSDLLKTKLFALCDRGLDLPDCVALAPSAAELAETLPWLEVQDLNPDWPAHVRATLADLGRKLGHGV